MIYLRHPRSSISWYAWTVRWCAHIPKNQTQIIVRAIKNSTVKNKKIKKLPCVNRLGSSLLQYPQWRSSCVPKYSTRLFTLPAAISEKAKPDKPRCYQINWGNDQVMIEWWSMRNKFFSFSAKKLSHRMNMYYLLAHAEEGSVFA